MHVPLQADQLQIVNDIAVFRPVGAVALAEAIRLVAGAIRATRERYRTGRFRIVDRMFP